MKRFLLLSGVSAISIAALAEVSGPRIVEDAIIHSISPNGKYAVSFGTAGMRIFDLESGEEYTRPSEYGYEMYDPGLTKCVSDNGIIVASDMMDETPVYWRNGEWRPLPIPEGSTYTNYPQAITADGRRICGTVGLAPTSYDEDALMQGPCIWNAEGDGFGQPVLLPHPEKDFLGTIPQYITAIDMSEDGKTIIGQIREASGMFSYPIIYKEDSEGEWSYEIPHADLMNPNNIEVIPFPGEGPIMPHYEVFMTPAEIEAYNDALNEYYDSGYTLPYPEYPQFMTPDEIEEYNKAIDEYNELAEVYNEKFYAWVNCMESLVASSPGYEYNAVQISPDGKSYGCTISTESENSGIGWGPSYDRSVWIFDLESDKITKYEKDGNLNLYYIANGGVALANTLSGSVSNSYVLQTGEVVDMKTWIGGKSPAYVSWMEENMVFPYYDYVYNEELDYYEEVMQEEVMTGRATSTPDLSVMALSVVNTWDYMNDGNAYIFNMNVESNVGSIRPATDEQTIYDLSGRKLKNATAPGIYIINGEKRVVR